MIHEAPCPAGFVSQCASMAASFVGCRFATSRPFSSPIQTCRGAITREAIRAAWKDRAKNAVWRPFRTYQALIPPTTRKLV